MKKIALWALAALLCGCNAVEKLTYQTIDMPDFEFNFDAAVATTLARAPVAIPEGWTGFTADETFTIMDDAFASIRDYRGVVRGVDIGGASLTYTPQGNSVMYDLAISSDDTELLHLSGEASGGGPISLSPDELNRLEKAVDKFVDRKPVTIRAIGATDADVSVMHFCIRLTDITVTAGLDL